MRRVLVTFVALLLVAAPAAQAAKPSVTFKRKTVTRLNASGARIKSLPRGRALQFDIAYSVKGIPARWNATADVVVTLTRGSSVLRFRTAPAQTSTGTWKWVVKGKGVRIPRAYPAGRYTVRVRVQLKHGTKRVARAAHAWRAAVT